MTNHSARMPNVPLPEAGAPDTPKQTALRSPKDQDQDYQKQ